MIKKVLLISALISAFTMSQEVSAKGKVPFGEVDMIKDVADLPNTEEYLIEGDRYLDLARLHKEINVAWMIPLWVTQEPKLVGYDKTDGSYYELKDSELDNIIKANNLDKEKLLTLSLYSRVGGKVVAAIIIAFMVWGFLPSKKKKVIPQNV